MKVFFTIFTFIIPLVISFKVKELSFVLTLIPLVPKDPNGTGSWISAYFAIASILFTMQSFLIPHMKEKLYDKEDYTNCLKSEYKDGWKKEQYRPLKNLLNFLSWTIMTCLLSIIFAFLFSTTEWKVCLVISSYYALNFF